MSKKEREMGDNDVMVSVIVLTYNHEKYIRQALDSILMQEVDFKYEILVGDDASTDGTPDILREYAEQYPEMISLTLRRENVGASRNAYDTMKLARGRYLASCEGDDYWCDSRKLQMQVDFLDERPQFSGCSHAIYLVDEHGIKLQRQKLTWISEKEVFSLSDFKGICLPGHGVSWVRRNFFLENDFDATILYKASRHVADRTNILIWLSRGDFFYIDRGMACYRQRAGNQNLTKLLYKNNSNRLREDYLYTCTLDEYSKKTLRVNAGFQYRKRELFVRALVTAILRPTDNNLALLKMIFHRAENRLWYVLGILPVLASVLLDKIRTYAM